MFLPDRDVYGNYILEKAVLMCECDQDRSALTDEVQRIADLIEPVIWDWLADRLECDERGLALALAALVTSECPAQTEPL